MAMPKGTLKWSTLAGMPDGEVIEYFKTTRGQVETHAKNSLRLLRRNFDHEGNKRAVPLPRYDIPGDASPTMPSADDYTNAKRAGSNARLDNAPRAVPHEFVACQAAWLTGYDDTARDIEAANKPAPDAPAIEPLPLDLPSGDPLAPLASALLPPMLKSMLPSMQKFIEEMRAKLSTVIVTIDKATGESRKLEGLHHMSAPKVIALCQRQNVMLVGPAGCGKTMIASSVQAATGRKTLVVFSCSAGTTESHLGGWLLPMGEQGKFVYVPADFINAYEQGGIILIDEMDAADANLLLFLNAALANGGILIPQRAASGLPSYVKRHPETIILAAANTWGHGATSEYVGRGALDAATIDRFYQVAIDYDHKLEAQLASEEIVSWVQNVRHHARAAKLRRVVSTRMILKLREAIASGIDMSEAKADLLASWSSDERAKVYAS